MLVIHLFVKPNDLIPGPTHIVSLSLNFLKLHSNELFSGILSILSTMFRYLKCMATCFHILDVDYALITIYQNLN